MQKEPARRVIFHLTRSEVFHIVPGGEHDYNEYYLVCGINYHDWLYRLKNPYYDAKLGVDWNNDGAVAYGRRLCKNCARVLEARRKKADAHV